MRAFEHKHVVGFEETNLVGNVYYASHVRWQGKCREMFLKEHIPDILEQFEQGLCLITTRCSCEYFAELSAFDEVIIRMRLLSLTQNRIGMGFEYWRSKNEDEELVAKGEQQIVCMKRSRTELQPVPVPQSLKDALRAYAGE
jgi:enediyne biosynthesis thioesterase